MSVCWNGSLGKNAIVCFRVVLTGEGDYKASSLDELDLDHVLTDKRPLLRYRPLARARLAVGG